MKNKRMKLFNNFWFGAILTLSIFMVIWCFDYADSFRSYNSTGGEVFMIALPLTLVWLKLREMGQKISKLKQCNKTLKRQLQL